MKLKLGNQQKSMYLIAAAILLAGLGSALFVYLTAENDLHGALGYEVIDGQVYSVAPGDSKMYIHDLELYGGKLNVMADEMMRWFAGLWRGKSLAFTIAVISIFISFGFFFVAGHMQPGSNPDILSKKQDNNV